LSTLQLATSAEYDEIRHVSGEYYMKEPNAGFSDIYEQLVNHAAVQQDIRSAEETPQHPFTRCLRRLTGLLNSEDRRLFESIAQFARRRRM